MAVLRGEGVADHVTDVVGDECYALDLERIENAGDVVALRFLVVAAGRLGREAHAAQIGNYHRAIALQVVGQRHPHVAGLAIAVQQHDRGSRATDAHMKLRTVRRDLPRVERLGVGKDRGTHGPFNLPHHERIPSHEKCPDFSLSEALPAVTPARKVSA